MDIVMPSLGADMEEGTLVEWQVKAGDTVRKGDIIAVIETQKGAIDMEVFDNGTITSLCLEPMTTVPVGTVMATLEQISITENVDQQPSHIKISPVARKQAAVQQLDLSSVYGSGPEGAILLDDLPSQLREKHVENIEQSIVKNSGTVTKGKSFEVSSMRQSIAAAMEKSKREIPHYYLSLDIDITRSQEYLHSINAQREPAHRLLLLALLLRGVALALIKFPEFNGYYQQGQFIASDNVNVGNAVSLRGGGLVVPAIHSVQTLSLDETMVALKDIIQRSRSGHLRSSELTDATVTVTSIGDRGADMVMGIIYPPQTAIIGFGKPVKATTVIDNAIAIRNKITVTLSADHRVSDGILGAKFLNALADLLEQPEML